MFICHETSLLGKVHEIEFIILFIIFYTFFTDKFVLLAKQILDQPETSSTGLVVFVLHIMLLIICLSTPFIYFNLFPKQKGLSNLSILPLQNFEALSLQVIYFLKYQILVLLIATPILTALILSTNAIAIFYIIFFSSSGLVLSSILILILAVTLPSRLTILRYYFLYIFFYFLFFGFTYWITDYYVYATIFILSCAWIILLWYWNKNWENWDQILNKYRPISQRSTQALSNLTYFKFPQIFMKSLRPFLLREFLSHIRNKNYIRLKIISLIVYLASLILVGIFYSGYFTSAISVLTILLIWEHYSHQFNEKYVIKESLIFMKVLPIKYYQYSLSKFISEFIYIIIILLLIIILTIIQGIEIIKILNILGIVVLFSVFVLYIITLIRIIFYDNPRMAGYAYHFLIIFTMVMIYNFYLVGPIITLCVVLYIQFISYRQFTR